MVVVFQHQLAQRGHGVGDVVSGPLVGGDGVERAHADDRGDSDPTAVHLDDTETVEQRSSGGVVDGVGADRHLAQSGLEVVGPAVVAGCQHVVQRREDLPLDGSLAQPVVAGALEEVTAVGDERGRLEVVQVWQEPVGWSRAECRSVVATIWPYALLIAVRR